MTACRARVVVAAAPEFTSSFAVGFTTPIPTISVVVARRTILGATAVHPPAEDPPIVVTVAQTTCPEPSVCREFDEELQFKIVLMRRFVPMIALPAVFNVPVALFNIPIPSPPARYSLPATDKFVIGEVVPIPTFPSVEASIVWPEIVRAEDEALTAVRVLA